MLMAVTFPDLLAGVRIKGFRVWGLWFRVSKICLQFELY